MYENQSFSDLAMLQRQLLELQRQRAATDLQLSEAINAKAELTAQINIMKIAHQQRDADLMHKLQVMQSNYVELKARHDQCIYQNRELQQQHAAVLQRAQQLEELLVAMEAQQKDANSKAAIFKAALDACKAQLSSMQGQAGPLSLTNSSQAPVSMPSTTSIDACSEPTPFPIPMSLPLSQHWLSQAGPSLDPNTASEMIFRAAGPMGVSKWISPDLSAALLSQASGLLDTPMAPWASTPDGASCTIFVTKLARHVTDDHLGRVFSAFGHVERSEMARRGHGTSNRNFAWVRFAMIDHANRALRFFASNDANVARFGELLGKIGGERVVVKRTMRELGPRAGSEADYGMPGATS